jgi:large subunit ribosomal protein L19
MGGKKRYISMKLTNLVDRLEARRKKEGLPLISVGDTVKIGVLIQEGEKTRVQPYQGTVIAQHRAGLHTTITVRRVFQSIGVERIFTIHSPALKGIQILRRAKVRKAKLYYLRDRVGKATRLKPRLADQGKRKGGEK